MVKENPEEIKKWPFRASSPEWPLCLRSPRILQAQRQSTQLKQRTFTLNSILLPLQGGSLELNTLPGKSGCLWGFQVRTPAPLHVPSSPVHTGRREPPPLFPIFTTRRPSFRLKPPLTTAVSTDPSRQSPHHCFTCVLSRLIHWRADPGLTPMCPPQCFTHCSVYSRWWISEVTEVILHACKSRAMSTFHTAHTALIPRGSTVQKQRFLLPNVLVQGKRRRTFPKLLLGSGVRKGPVIWNVSPQGIPRARVCGCVLTLTQPQSSLLPPLSTSAHGRLSSGGMGRAGLGPMRTGPHFSPMGTWAEDGQGWCFS